jgi:PBSX family phage terminase large subunit
MATRSKTGLFAFKPFSKKQRQILKFWEEHYPTHKKDILIADGSIRSGKTIAMIPSFLRWSNYNFKYKDFIIAGKSIGALKRNVIKPMLQILEAWGWPYRYNRSENYIEIGSNMYYMFGANSEASQDVLQGLTAAGSLADEVALFPQSFVDQMIGRCSVDASKIFMNCNPGNPFHRIKTEFIDKAAEKNILYLHFLLNDNLTLSEEIKQRYERMFTGVFYKRYILGLWVMAEGVIYDMFDEDLHVTDEIPEEFDREYVCCDYGTANPTVFLTNRVKKGVSTFFHEYHYSGKDRGISRTDYQYANILEDYYQEGNMNKRVVPIAVDPSAKSFITELVSRGFYVVQAKNEVIEGIRNVASELSLGRLKIHKGCQQTIKEFQVYGWDPKAQERGVDKPIKENDHCMDAMRYCIKTFISDGVNVQKLRW